MSAVARAFYRNPIVFLGVLQAGVAAAIAQGVIGWQGAIAIAVIVPLQRHFVRPARKR